MMQAAIDEAVKPVTGTARLRLRTTAAPTTRPTPKASSS